ncbi:hypothetical protein ACFQZQ_14475 [Lysobacter koreensis]|uniref:Uncharacterized protein n=1 Tax=Lysobacter koreensis TaxID=266122 RepID=A0ABW2YRF3_9GAMM
MSNVNVSLDIRNSAAPPPPGNGYTDTTASNGAVYSYQYSGGTDGAGGVQETTGSGSGTITVTAGGDPRYQVNNVVFGPDPGNQLSWAWGATPNIAVITDIDTQSEDSSYGIIVRDSTANCTFRCDPPISNKPG